MPDNCLGEFLTDDSVCSFRGQTIVFSMSEAALSGPEPDGIMVGGVKVRDDCAKGRIL